uniref:Tctex1 domain-containing protein 2 n=1 Tax=Strigamia maritima TaxID=126957 RepID=T1IZT3_STRMM
MADEDEAVNTYQIRPRTHHKFQPGVVKVLIQESLNEDLDGKTYDVDGATDWCKGLTEKITQKMKELKTFKRYKYVVQVVVGERRGQGIK